MKRRPLIGVLLGALVLASCGTSALSSATTPGARDLHLTPGTRTALLDAGAKYHQLKPSDYLGLQPGTAYYAIDVTTHTYYAGAGLDPSPHSLKAQVSSQDDGGYILFVRRASSKHWAAYNDGLGAEQGVKCPLVIPAAVLKVWNWRAGSCFPPS